MASVKRWATDHALIQACKRGDPAAWEQLIRRYRRLIYSIPVAYRLRDDGADEIFQRVSVKLFEHLARVRRSESLPAWIAVTTRRACQAYRRESYRLEPVNEEQPQAVEDPPDVAEAMFQASCEHALLLAFERLGSACRDLLSALYREEPRPSYQEIARRLDRPIGSLGPTRTRCLEKLRTFYLKMGGEQP